MTILDPLIDVVIDKGNGSTETDVKNIFAPICKDLNCRIAIIEAVLRDECETEDEAGADEAAADVGEIGPLSQGESSQFNCTELHEEILF